MLQACGDRPGIPLGREKAAHAVQNGLRYPSRVRCDHRNAERGGLQDDDPETFGVAILRYNARQRQDRRAPHPRQHVRVRQRSEKLNAAAQTRAFRLPLQIAAQRPLADDHEPGYTSRFPQLGDGVDEIARALLLDEPAHMKNQIVIARIGPARNRRGVDADIVTDCSFRRKPLRQRGLADEIRDADEQGARPLQPLAAENVVDERRAARFQHRRVKRHDIEAVQRGDQRHAKPPAQRQPVHAVHPEMGVQQARPVLAHRAVQGTRIRRTIRRTASSRDGARANFAG